MSEILLEFAVSSYPSNLVFGGLLLNSVQDVWTNEMSLRATEGSAAISLLSVKKEITSSRRLVASNVEKFDAECGAGIKGPSGKAAAIMTLCRLTVEELASKNAADMLCVIFVASDEMLSDEAAVSLVEGQWPG